MSKPQPDFRALYDAKIPEYSLRRDPDSYSARRIALEVREFKNPNLLSVLPFDFEYQSIAEIGCATGELIATFPGAAIKRRVGFDLSPLNIAAATSRFRNTEFTTEDFRQFGPFDLVILSDVLEHVEDDADLLRDAAQIARLVVVNLPLEKCLTNLLRNYGPDDVSGHLRSYSLREGLALFGRAGLTICNSKQVWVMETQYERNRQQLNKRMLGTAFNGSAPTRAVKHILFHLCNTVRPLGRVTFSSNLFACAKRA
jgi:SAM-dependent methyltransferase